MTQGKVSLSLSLSLSVFTASPALRNATTRGLGWAKPGRDRPQTGRSVERALRRAGERRWRVEERESPRGLGVAADLSASPRTVAREHTDRYLAIPEAGKKRKLRVISKDGGRDGQRYCSGLLSGKEAGVSVNTSGAHVPQTAVRRASSSSVAEPSVPKCSRALPWSRSRAAHNERGRAAPRGKQHGAPRVIKSTKEHHN